MLVPHQQPHRAANSPYQWQFENIARDGYERSSIAKRRCTEGTGAHTVCPLARISVMNHGDLSW